MKSHEENKTASLKHSNAEQEKRHIISEDNIINSITSADDIFDERHRTILDFVPYPMAVLSLDDKINYLNPAFTQTFGWTLDELRGKPLPYIPAGLQDDVKNHKKILLREKLHRFESKRFTKDGRLLDVIIRGAIYTNEDRKKGDGQIIITRNITQEKKLLLTNETLLRISTALPEYPVLEELLDYIASETKRLLNSESATVAIHDDSRNEIFFLGAAYDDSDAKYRVKKVRFPVENSITGRVIKTGKPVIVHDSSKEPDYYPGVDEQADIKTENMLFVPLRSYDRTIGVLAAMNKKEGSFDETDLELLNMIAGTVALSVENARYSEELKEAYHEVTSLNRAKDKVIDHLSHELKTPVSVLLASLNILAKRLDLLPKETWLNTLNRAKRNIERILAIQYEVEDIMQNRDYSAYHMLSHLLEECADELEILAVEELGEGEITRRIRKKIDEIFGPKISEPENIELAAFLNKKLDQLKYYYDKRRIEISLDFEDSVSAHIPEDVLDKVLTGLVRNAIENTPDRGKIELSIKPRSGGTELIIEDFGVGITDESQRRIFEGFFTTRETMDYSSKRPFEFNAGGKGADLLRIKIFAERYNFKVDMRSSRCGYIPEEIDICPGNIMSCSHCDKVDDCYRSGGTRFTLFFPEVSRDESQV